MGVKAAACGVLGFLSLGTEPQDASGPCPPLSHRSLAQTQSGELLAGSFEGLPSEVKAELS